MSVKPLQDKVILISGASQGIGEQVAMSYAEAGATVVLLARHQKKLEAVYDKIADAGYPEPFAIRFDLLNAEEKEFDQLAMAVLNATGRLDGIVHCANYFYALSPITFQTVEEWVNQYRVNTVAPMGLTRAFLPALQEAPDASVIFVGETHAQTPKAYWGGFGASKSALVYLAQVCADEWTQYPNMRANVLIPGSVNSPLRIKTHPGESDIERKDIADITPAFVDWMSDATKGRTGEVIYL